MMLTELSAKRLQLLKEVLDAPLVSRSCELTVLWHAKVIEDLKAAAPSLSIELSFAGVRTAEGNWPGIFNRQPSARSSAVCN